MTSVMIAVRYPVPMGHAGHVGCLSGALGPALAPFPRPVPLGAVVSFPTAALSLRLGDRGWRRRLQPMASRYGAASWLAPHPATLFCETRDVVESLSCRKLPSRKSRSAFRD